MDLVIDPVMVMVPVMVPVMDTGEVMEAVADAYQLYPNDFMALADVDVVVNPNLSIDQPID